MPQVIPQLSLKTAQVNPVTWQPIEYKPMQEDMNLLANSFARMEERRRTANEKISAMDTAFGEMRSKLHQDAETLKWFDNWSKGLKDQVQQAAQFGNYGEAINSAVRLAGEASKSGELIDRIKTNEQYQELDNAQKARVNKTISQDTYNWWKQNNPYKFKPIVDGFGNVTGGEEIDFSAPYDDINFAGLYDAAFKLISPDKNEVSRSSRRDSSTSDETGSRGGGSASSSTQSYVRVKKEDILKNVQELIALLPNGINQVEQSYEVYKYKTQQLNNELSNLESELTTLVEGTTEYNNKNKEIEDLKSQINKREQLMTSNGGPISYEEYYTRMLANEVFPESLAYYWLTDSKSSASSSHTSTGSPSSPYTRTPGYGDGSYTNDGRSGNVDTANAPSVRRSETVDYTRGIYNTATNITNRFGNGK